MSTFKVNRRMSTLDADVLPNRGSFGEKECETKLDLTIVVFKFQKKRKRLRKFWKHFWIFIRFILRLVGFIFAGSQDIFPSLF